MLSSLPCFSLCLTHVLKPFCPVAPVVNVHWIGKNWRPDREESCWRCLGYGYVSVTFSCKLVIAALTVCSLEAFYGGMASTDTLQRTLGGGLCHAASEFSLAVSTVQPHSSFWRLPHHLGTLTTTLRDTRGCVEGLPGLRSWLCCSGKCSLETHIPFEHQVYYLWDKEITFPLCKPMSMRSQAIGALWYCWLSILFPVLITGLFSLGNLRLKSPPFSYKVAKLEAHIRLCSPVSMALADNHHSQSWLPSISLRYFL